MRKRGRVRRVVPRHEKFCAREFHEASLSLIMRMFHKCAQTWFPEPRRVSSSSRNESDTKQDTGKEERSCVVE